MRKLYKDSVSFFTSVKFYYILVYCIFSTYFIFFFWNIYYQYLESHLCPPYLPWFLCSFLLSSGRFHKFVFWNNDLISCTEKSALYHVPNGFWVTTFKNFSFLENFSSLFSFHISFISVCFLLFLITYLYLIGTDFFKIQLISSKMHKFLSVELSGVLYLYVNTN